MKNSRDALSLPLLVLPPLKQTALGKKYGTDGAQQV